MLNELLEALIGALVHFLVDGVFTNIGGFLNDLLTPPSWMRP